MLPFTPNSYVPLPSPKDRIPDDKKIGYCSDYEYHLRSNSRPRLLGRAGLTQSLCVRPASDGASTMLGDTADRHTFIETVQVVPVSDGYQIVRPSASIDQRVQGQSQQRSGLPPPSLALQASMAGHRFSHNIGSQDMLQRMEDRMTSVRLRHDFTRSLDVRKVSMSTLCQASIDNGATHLPVNGRSGLTTSLYVASQNNSGGPGRANLCGSPTLTVIQKGQAVSCNSLSPIQPSTSGGQYGAERVKSAPSTQRQRKNSSKKEEEFQCSCQLYHSHTFKGRPVNKEIMEESHKFVETLTASLKAVQKREESHEDLRNIFWTPSLSFHPYQHGDKKVEFADLWPSMAELREHFQNSGIQRTVLRDVAVLDLCKLALTCGPVRLLRCLIELELIRVDQLVENGTGMLHMAVLAHNTDAIQYLTSTKISPKIRDKAGNTADQVCYNSTVRRHLPPKYLLHKESRQAGDSKMVLKPSLQDKDTIFKLAANPKYFDEIQKKLQSLDFNVNTECDTNGDFLLHIVCKKGLSQLPLMMALVKIQGADVELCNAEGHTPLMLAAASGNCVLSDVLMCLFGADPNKPNPNTGRCALHYAVEGNHRKTVECLLRRGADVNVEDHLGRRPDDIPLCQGTNDDCHEVIKFNRTRRIEMLSERIQRGELERHHLLPTDMFVVDDEGYTLIMTAAIYNRPNALRTLLQTNDTTINAQHIKTGMTALAIAAQMGNVEAVNMLISHGANPAIADMKGYLPLHHAVLNNQEQVVDALLEYFPQCYWGLYTATRLCKRTSIHVKLKSAFVRRQEEIVTPKLLECSMNGSASELYQLLDEGDNINVKSGSGNWPLYLAVENGHLEVVKLLFERGGDIRKRHSTTGETVLHIAAKMGHLNIMQYLLNFCQQTHIRSSRRPSRKLLDINTTDLNNHTPLQVAAEKGFSKIVETLLQHGATTALLDAGGQLITCPQFEGVRMQIEAHRQQHTKDIVTCITDRSKKAFERLQRIWLPRFDHNLRTKQGDTPLMVACASGKLQIVKFLLESAVYQQTRLESESSDDSDADSGVLDPSGNVSHRRPMKRSDADGEEMQMSGTFTQSTEAQAGQLGVSGDFTHSMEVIPEDAESNREAEVQLPTANAPSPQRTLETLLHDVNRPKGLYIFHDGLISHVCAVNLTDGSTALHRAIEHGDNYQMVKVLLGADPSCVNIQNNAGLTPLHLACKLGRKRVVEQLLVAEGIDVNARTLDCHLPEEMTTTKSVIRMVQKARLQQTGMACPPPTPTAADSLEAKDESSSNSASIMGSTVNFDKLHSQYEKLRKENK